MIQDENHLKEINEMLLYHPLLSSNLYSSFFTGHYVNPTNLFRSNGNGMYQDWIDFEEIHNSAPFISNSCYSLHQENMDELYKVQPIACLSNSYVICEENSDINWIPADIDINEIEMSFIETAFVHSTNSMSSCFAFCSRKVSVRSILLLQNICLCLKDTIESEKYEIEKCHTYIPCSSSPLQKCGCQALTNKPTVFPLIMNLENKIWPFIENCEQLKSQGIFISGKFISKNNEMYCKGWQSVCEPGWLLFDEYCVHISDKETEYDSISNIACKRGSPITHRYLGKVTY